MGRIIIGITAVMIILIIILASFCWHKKYFSPKDDTILYIMGISRRYFIEYLIIVGLSSIFFGFLSVMSIIDFDAFTFCFFYCFILLGVTTCICAFGEKYALTIDSLIHYIPFLPPKEIKIHEITTVKYTENRTNSYGAGRKMLVGYHNKKKLFSIDESLEGFDLLYNLFLEDGKIERIPIIENFSVTEKKRNIILTIFSSIFFFALFTAMLWNRDEIEWYYLIMAAFLMLIGISDVIHLSLWKVTIDFHTISVRNSFGIVRTYEISQITEVHDLKAHIVLFIGKKKIVKVPKTYENFDFFLERLLRHGIKVRRMYS